MSRFFLFVGLARIQHLYKMVNVLGWNVIVDGVKLTQVRTTINQSILDMVQVY